MDTKRFEAPVLEPTTQRFIDALSSQGGKPVYQLSIAEAREVLEGLQRQPVEKLPSRKKISPSLADRAARSQHGSFGPRIQPASSPWSCTFTVGAGYLGMKTFGMSAPIKVVSEHFGFVAEHVVSAAKEVLSRAK